jgi:hypothetical protein
VRRVPAWTLAALLAAIYLVLNPPSADLAAQTYRTWLFQHDGWTLWNGNWYAGHHVPAYSMLFPALSALFGPQTVGAMSAITAAWAFEHLARFGERGAARPAALWFAAATPVCLVTGRLTFALGLACGLLAALALARGRPGWSTLAAVATALASPVAAVFLAVGVTAWAIVERRARVGALLVTASLGPVIALSLLFPDGGSFPFAAQAFWPSLAGTLLVLVLLPRREDLLRGTVALYAVLLILSATLSTPMGGNAVRLGALFAGPVAALALWPDRRRVLLLVAPALLYWQWTAPVVDWARAAGDPSIKQSYYTGMLRFLTTRPGQAFRVEIPFTRSHWETARVAPHVPLARGWERQTDREDNKLFYDHEQPLTDARYKRWLDTNAVRYVALPDAKLDYSAQDEAALVRRRPSYLREVWRDAHWRIFEVRDPGRMAIGQGRARGVRATLPSPADGVNLSAPGPGRVLLRVRWTPYWRVIPSERGCVTPAGHDGAWTAVELRGAGRVQLRPDFSLSRVGATSPRGTCPT